jgi:hypothetical protein
MRLITLTVIAAMLVLASPASASAPVLTLNQRIGQLNNEEKVELAISTFTKNKAEARCAKKIAYKESRYRPEAKNKVSSARGIWQLMWGKPDWDIFKQAEQAHKYVQHRYDTWCKAYSFHQERNWF